MFECACLQTTCLQTTCLQTTCLQATCLQTTCLVHSEINPVKSEFKNSQINAFKSFERHRLISNNNTKNKSFIEKSIK